MQREIKFRQYYNGEFRYFGFIDEGFTSPPSSKKEKYPVEQFTGLHDKNGKEIYEGDIVKHWYGKGKVFMRLGCWYIENYKELGYCDSQEVEIIGNNHKNPELLK
jgi:hypothetical protein